MPQGFDSREHAGTCRNSVVHQDYGFPTHVERWPAAPKSLQTALQFLELQGCDPFDLHVRDSHGLDDLAIQVARDGEGISKFVTFEVGGAKSWQAARKIGLACANSPILKTAIAGEDPNWGRVVMAVGKSGEAANRDRLAIWFGPHCVARDGERAADYDEKTVAAYMKNKEILIRVDAGVGNAAATVWTCDLTHDYISINADYRS